jgi:hypothetical protein
MFASLPHQRKIGVGAESFRLAGDRQCVAAVDHRFALGSPALASADPKKSFSGVNSPIWAWSVFTSIEGWAASTFVSPKTLVARSTN